MRLFKGNVVSGGDSVSTRSQIPGAFAISLLPTILALSLAFEHDNLLQGAGLVFLVCGSVFGFEYICFRLTGHAVSRRTGCTLSALSIVYLIIGIFSPETVQTLPAVLLLSYAVLAGLAYQMYRTVRSFDGIFSSLSVLLALIVFIFTGWDLLARFSPDSFYYYQIAKSFDSDFGLMNTIRQYVVQTDYNISFPYFYPLLVYITDKLTGLDRLSPVLINIIATGGIASLLLYASKRYACRLWPGAVTILALLTSKPFLDEVFSGRAIPVSLLFNLSCLLIILYIFTKDGYKQISSSQQTCENIDRDAVSQGTETVQGQEEVSTKASGEDVMIQSGRREKCVRYALLGLVGFLAGLSTVVRFDNLPGLCYLILIAFLMSKGRRFISASAILITSLIGIIPWCLYSYSHFGMPWASDNGGTLLLVTPTVPNRIPLENIPNLFNAPLDWCIGFVQKSLKVIGNIIICAVPADIIIVACLYKLFRARDKKLAAVERNIYIPIFIFYLLKTGMYCLVGYPDARYHVESICVITMCLAVMYQRKRADSESFDLQENTSFSAFPQKLKWLSGVVLLSTLVPTTYSWIHLFKAPLVQPVARAFSMPSEFVPLHEELTAAGANEQTPVLFLGNEHATSGFYLGGWSNRKTFVNITNLTKETLVYFLQKHPNVEFVSVSKKSDIAQDVIDYLESIAEKKELSEVWLYKTNQRSTSD